MSLIKLRKLITKIKSELFLPSIFWWRKRRGFGQLEIILHECWFLHQRSLALFWFTRRVGTVHKDPTLTPPTSFNRIQIDLRPLWFLLSRPAMKLLFTRLFILRIYNRNNICWENFCLNFLTDIKFKNSFIHQRILWRNMDLTKGTWYFSVTVATFVLTEAGFR